MGEERLFKEIDVANFSAQLRKDRYPDPEDEYLSSNAEHILDFGNTTHNGLQTTETYNGPPHIGLWRMNLAVLSQKYNLYFLASRDNIHCYIPRDLKQTIPSTPDLIIEPPRSEDGIVVGGFIDEDHPHSVNHMIVGNLGDLEILLMACDDGDIIAFYTHQIQDELARLDVTTRVRDVRPFFHQNVGITAWGLAIHQKSRLIAVSSNHKEVTIFVHGYSKDTEEEELLKCADDQHFPHLIELENEPTSFRDREQNYRIAFEIGDEGDNIPTIDFVNDTAGEAEMIIAADIKGTTWLLDPWTAEAKIMPGIYRTIDRHAGHHRAWGILSLSLEDFKLTSNIHEALGLERMTMDVLNKIEGSKRSFQGSYFNVTPPPPRTAQMAKRGFEPRHVLTFEADDSGDGSDSSSSDSGPSLISGSASTFTPRRNSSFDPTTAESARQARKRTRRCPSPEQSIICTERRKHQKRKEEEAAHDPEKLNYRLQKAKDHQHDTDLVWLLLKLPKSMRSHILNWTDLTYRGNSFRYLDENGIIPMTISPTEKDEEREPVYPARIFLRTYTHDIELISTSLDVALDTRLMHPLKDRGNQLMGGGLNRFNFLALIPELNLVVVGSQNGRVCLLTLTRMDDPNRNLPPFVSFRLDQILPFMKQQFSFQPNCPLLGMAVSPLQSSARDDKVRFGRRWRLILHYYDHTLLSYELGRDEDGLVVF